MRAVAVVLALVAVGSTVSAATTCSKEIRISEPTPVIECDVVNANVIVEPDLGGDLVIEGPKQLRKDFIIRNASKLLSITSSSINSIQGTLELDDVPLMSKFQMESLTHVEGLKLVKLPLLRGLTLGTEGVTKSNHIEIIDTFFQDLDGLNIATADKITISNNRKLAKLKSSLIHVNTSFQVTNNNDMEVTMSHLESAGDMQFRQVKTVNAPLLSTVGSIKIEDSPQLLSVSANNLTFIKNSLTFNNNKKLSKLSFQALHNIKGDMTIQNNTDLKGIDGFPKLKAVGAILLRGSFERVNLPSLDDVQGSAEVYSTTDIRSFCDFFDKMKSKNNIRGVEKCKSNVKNANEAGSSQSNSDTEKDAAGVIHVNVALFSLIVFAGLAQML